MAWKRSTVRTRPGPPKRFKHSPSSPSRERCRRGPTGVQNDRGVIEGPTDRVGSTHSQDAETVGQRPRQAIGSARSTGFCVVIRRDTVYPHHTFSGGNINIDGSRKRESKLLRRCARKSDKAASSQTKDSTVAGNRDVPLVAECAYSEKQVTSQHCSFAIASVAVSAQGLSRDAQIVRKS
jgi:hypothetical protein